MGLSNITLIGHLIIPFLELRIASCIAKVSSPTDTAEIANQPVQGLSRERETERAGPEPRARALQMTLRKLMIAFGK